MNAVFSNGEGEFTIDEWKVHMIESIFINLKNKLRKEGDLWRPFIILQYIVPPTYVEKITSEALNLTKGSRFDGAKSFAKSNFFQRCIFDAWAQFQRYAMEDIVVSVTLEDKDIALDLNKMKEALVKELNTGRYLNSYSELDEHLKGHLMEVFQGVVENFDRELYCPEPVNWTRYFRSMSRQDIADCIYTRMSNSIHKTLEWEERFKGALWKPYVMMESVPEHSYIDLCMRRAIIASGAFSEDEYFVNNKQWKEEAQIFVNHNWFKNKVKSVWYWTHVKYIKEVVEESLEQDDSPDLAKLDVAVRNEINQGLSCIQKLEELPAEHKLLVRNIVSQLNWDITKGSAFNM